jgi:hypothetical protein
VKQGTHDPSGGRFTVGVMSTSRDNAIRQLARSAELSIKLKELQGTPKDFMGVTRGCQGEILTFIEHS